MENKKTKLTISGNPKKSFKNFDPSKNKGKKTVVIDKQSSKPTGKGTFYKSSGLRSPNNRFSKGAPYKQKFDVKTPPAVSDFEKRKLAEQRATKRLKGDPDKEKKQKLGTKKRELKLTVSRALSDEIETR